MNDFKTTLSVDSSPAEVYQSLTNDIANWWTEMFEGTSNEVGKSFTVRFGSAVFKKFAVTELVADKKVVWDVVDSFIDLPELTRKTEWIGTQIIWEIATHQEKTILTLTHVGLVPEIECFSICENGWRNFTKSLHDFLDTGVGKPYQNR